MPLTRPCNVNVMLTWFLQWIWVLRFLYLDGSDQVWSLLAEVEKASNGYPIGQIVDKGHIVDQVVCLSNAQDDYGGHALWVMKVNSRGQINIKETKNNAK